MVPVKRLRAHEETDSKRTATIVAELRHEPVFRYPVIVDEQTCVILDGHHRHEAFVALGFKEVPCLLVDYFSNGILLRSRRNDVSVSKDDVIGRALRGQLYPPKTTKHTFVAPWQQQEFELQLSLEGRLCLEPS